MPEFLVFHTVDEYYQAVEVPTLAEFMKQPENPEIKELYTRIYKKLAEGEDQNTKEMQNASQQINILQLLEQIKEQAQAKEKYANRLGDSEAPFPEDFIQYYKDAFIESQMLKYAPRSFGSCITGEFPDQASAIEAGQNDVRTHSYQELLNTMVDYYGGEEQLKDVLQDMYNQVRGRRVEGTKESFNNLLSEQELDEKRQQLEEHSAIADIYKEERNSIEVKRQWLEESQTKDPIIGTDLTDEPFPDGKQNTLNFQRYVQVHGSQKKKQNPEETEETVLPDINNQSLSSLENPDGDVSKKFQEYLENRKNQGNDQNRGGGRG